MTDEYKTFTDIRIMKSSLTIIFQKVIDERLEGSHEGLRLEELVVVQVGEHGVLRVPGHVNHLQETRREEQS